MGVIEKLAEISPTIARLKTENETLLRRMQELEEALKPFAKIGNEVVSVLADDDWIDEYGTELFTVSDCRHASDALQPSPKT